MRAPDSEPQQTAELADYLRVVRERWWVIVATVVIVVLVALAVSLNSTPQYRATARLLYQDSNLDQALFGSQVFANSNQDREVQTGATLVKLDAVANAVASELGSTKSSVDLLAMVEVESETSTNVIAINSVSTDPVEAAKVANSFAGQFVLFRQTTDRATVASARELVKEQLDSLTYSDASSDYGLMLKEKYESLRILESMQNGGFTIVQQAAPPSSPFAPQTTRNSILALVVDLVVGVGLAFLLDYLDRRIKDQRMMEDIFGAPVLAAIPSVNGRWKEDRSGAPIGFGSHPELLEPFRTLRSSLQYFDVDKSVHRLLITSGLPTEGKTTTSVNLGLSLALSGKRVIVLEADLRRPMVHKYLGLDNNLGLSSVLAGTAQVEDALQLVRADQFVPPRNRRGHGEAQDALLLQRNMGVLTSGLLPPNPAELLGSSRMAKAVVELSEMCDFLLIDTPPLLSVSDAVTLTPLVDGVIVAALLNSTSRDDAWQARNILDRAGARIIGVVAGNLTRKSRRYGYKYGYGYGYGYGYVEDLPASTHETA